jgi:hypothetical protein
MSISTEKQCTYPKCQAINGCVGVCSKEPVAWREVAGKTTQYYDYNEDGRGEPLYAAPVHSIDMIQECVDETAKHRHDEDWYGQWQWQCGYERGWDKGYEAGWDNRGKEEKNNWVGLTDEDINFYWAIATDREAERHFPTGHHAFASLIQDKLKRLNT